MYKNNHRIRIIFAFICLALFGIILYFIYFMVSKNDFYQSEYERLSNQYLYGWTAPRGRILDVNGNVLVDNEAVSVLAYSKSSSTTVTKEVELAKKINELIEVSGDDIDEEDMRSFYLLFHREELVAMAGEEVENQYKKREITLSEYNNILKSFISSEQLSNYNEDDKRVIQIYQWMNQSYSYDIKVIKRDLSTEELAALSEHMGELMGCFITYDWERVYFYGDTLKSILGGVSSSTQGIPLDDIDYYSSDYSLNDRVGISGLEKHYDEVLKGEKAKYKINGNHSISLVSSAKRGNDIVLTIDIELQQAVDEILPFVENNEISLIHTTDINGTIGSIRVLRKLENKNIQLIGYDLCEESAQALSDGYCKALLYHDVLKYGAASVEFLARKILSQDEENSPKEYIVYPEIVMKYNVDHLLHEMDGLS